ncbi:MAG: DUF805 domain-containing protein [Verrucomicrobiota bacterium]
MTINCPTCNQEIEIFEEHAGTVAACPSCQSEMVLPDISGFQAANLPVPQPESQLPPIPALRSQSINPPSGSAAYAILQRSKKPKLGIFSLLFSFSGRLPRSYFWAIKLGGVFVVGVILSLVNAVFVVNQNHLDEEDLVNAVNIQLIIFLVVLLVFFLISLSCNVRRWHDRDKSGVWILLLFVPVIGGLWQFIETGFMPGTDGPNRYGEKP